MAEDRIFQFCRKCVQPNTRPGIVFDEQGVCLACRYSESIDQINWQERRAELEALAVWARAQNVSGYDCIIGVSGGKDSLRQAMYVRDEIGLKPLLVSLAYPPQHQNERGAYNLGNLISLGFDCITVSLGPATWKKLMRQSFLKFGNFGISTEIALYASAPKVAIAYHIPLIFLGENPSMTYGTMDIQSQTADANRMKHCNTLQGGDLSRVMAPGVKEQDILWYGYSSDEEMEAGNLRVRYLGYYMRDFNKFTNSEFAVKHGLRLRTDSPEETGSYYGFEALDEDYVTVNQMLKYVKFGFGKVSDEVCDGVRSGKLTRAEAVDLVHRYDGKCGEKYIRRFCEYLEISRAQFDAVLDRFRDETIFEKDAAGKWQLKVNVT